MQGQFRSHRLDDRIILIDQLNFDCEYEVEVDDVQNRKVGCPSKSW